MKPERAFIAERPLAQHCPELVRAGPAPMELTPTLERFGERLARSFAANLARLWGEGPLKVTGNPARECTMAELTTQIAPLAANSLLAAGPQDARFLVSMEAEAVLRLVDRAFGGKGEAPAVLPESFPLSAELLVGRIETMVIDTMAQALGAESEIRALRRDGSLAQLAPFADDRQLVVLSLQIEQGECPPWQLTFAFPHETLAELFSHEENARAQRPEPRGEADPLGEPFGEMPLTVTAVLVDMRIPFSSLSSLQPGQVLPVAVARSVPLRIGDKTIAHGTVGEMDDRVAVQITQAF